MYLNRKQAAEYLRDTHGLKVAAATLAKAAVYGDGPAFRKFSRSVYYVADDLDRWVASKLSWPLSSTSDRGCERQHPLAAAPRDGQR